MEALNSTRYPAGKTPAPGDEKREPLSTVLVVDDSRVVRAYLHAQLQRDGYEVLLARDGNEGVELLSDDIGIVLLDLCMPEMGGLACLHHIRENHPDIPAIMITASHEISLAVEAMTHGAFDFVTKPFIPAALLALVRQAMKSRNQARRQRLAESGLRSAGEREAIIADPGWDCP